MPPSKMYAIAAAAGVSATGAMAGPPAGYYDSVDTGSPAALRATVHDVIDDHVRYPYTDVATDTWNVLELADENPDDSTSILDIYRNASYTKQGGGNAFYNREHSWPKSYGFPDDHDGNYAYTDCHHLFLSDSSYNGARSNYPYGTCDAACSEWSTDFNVGRGGGVGAYPDDDNWVRTGDVWETWTGRRGEVARAMFYMDVRYEGGVHGASGFDEPDLIVTDDRSLIVTTGGNAATAYMGELCVLLDWHASDPVDALEQNRNDVIYSYQGNRNPFIDHPEWAELLFAGVCGPWFDILRFTDKADIPSFPEATFVSESLPFEDPDAVLGPSPVDLYYYQVVDPLRVITLTKTVDSILIR